MKWLRCILAGMMALPGLLPAQADTRRPSDGRILTLLQTMQVANAPELAPVINALLSDTGAHMRMAPGRIATKADSVRAAALVKDAHAALDKYKDLALAEREGYVRFLPWLEEQPIYHYNNIQNGMATLQTFDVTKPISLLYRKDAKGKFELVGAMYYAAPNATPDELDARLPLGIAHWHEHVDFCGPKPEVVRAAAETIDAKGLAKWLSITSRAECDAAGGMFVPRLFGWMAHAYFFASDDPKVIWGADGHAQMHIHH